jgi:hypothetical protein
MIDSLEKENRYQISCMDSHISINDRISNRNVQIFDRYESKHVGSHIFWMINLPVTGSATAGYEITPAAINLFRYQPAMEIIEFKPADGFQVKCDLRK